MKKYLTLISLCWIIFLFSGCSKDKSINTGDNTGIVGNWMTSYQVLGDDSFMDSSGFMISYSADSTWESNQTAFYLRTEGIWTVSGDTLIHTEQGYFNFDSLHVSPFLYTVDDTSLVWIDYEESILHEFHFRRADN